MAAPAGLGGISARQYESKTLSLPAQVIYVAALTARWTTREPAVNELLTILSPLLTGALAAFIPQLGKS